MEEKQVIRKQVFKFRKDATEEQIRMKSSQIVEKLLHMEEFISADKVLAYMDFNHEVMTRTFIEKCWELGKKVAVPKVNGKEMTFYDLTSFEQLEDGYYHIPEPAYGEAVYREDGFMLVPELHLMCIATVLVMVRAFMTNISPDTHSCIRRQLLLNFRFLKKFLLRTQIFFRMF